MFKLLLFFAAFINFSDSARILMVSPTPSYSHQITFQPIWKELALRGHDMVVLTTDPLKDPTIPNLREIDLSFAYKIWSSNLKKIANSSGFFSDINTMVGGMYDILEQELLHPEVQALIKNETEHFDLVMIEYMFPTMWAFKERFDCPFIGIASMDLGGLAYEFMGNPKHAVAYPEAIFAFPDEMTIFHRTLAMIIVPVFEFVWINYFISRDLALIEKYFGQDTKNVEEIARSVDMVFINANPIFNRVRPITPATVIISGGIHIQEPKPLPQDLETFLNNSKNGVIYFSLGSNVKSKDIPADIKTVLIETLSELPYDVLWKYEDDNFPQKPKNVKIIQWAPQQDLLGHPKIKLFITQGGMQSLEEALFNHIPLICIPFFADQPSNANKVKNKGIGLMVDDYKKLTKQEFKEKILEVIENPKYKNKIKELGELMRDEPMTALEKAIWWTEYVLRHGGAKHLKAKTLPYYQFYYFDLIGLLLGVFVVIYVIIKKCYKFICQRKQKTE